MVVCRHMNKAQMYALDGAELGLEREEKTGRLALHCHMLEVWNSQDSQEFHIRMWFSRSYGINLSRNDRVYF